MNKQYLELYYQWYTKTEGVPPRINGVEINALKQLVSYFKDLSKKDDSLAYSYFEAVLRRWDSLPRFYRRQKDLKQINSNINAIIRAIKQTNKSEAQSVANDYRKSL